MSLKLFIFLMIANLLVCPLRCLNCQAEANVQNNYVEAPACGCCHDAKDEKKSSNEEPTPQDDCSCPSCICEGAVVQTAPEIPQADFCIDSKAWEILKNDLHVNTTSKIRRVTTNYRLNPRCAQDALVAFQMWLI